MSTQGAGPRARSCHVSTVAQKGQTSREHLWCFMCLHAPCVNLEENEKNGEESGFGGAGKQVQEVSFL